MWLKPIILLLLDPTVDAAAFAQTIESLGFTAAVAANDEQVSAFIGSEQAPIVIYPAAPPVNDEAFPLLKKFRDDNDRVLFVAVSTNIDYIQDWLPIGIDDYLTELHHPPLIKKRLGGYLSWLSTAYQERLSRHLDFMTHEIRNRLSTIKGYSEVLADGFAGPVNDQQIEFLAVIGRKAMQILNVVDDQRDLIGIECNHLSLYLTPVYASKIIENVFNHFISVAEQKSQALEIEVSNALPLVLADEYRLTQVIDSIVDNSIAYTPEGGHIAIRATLLGSDPNYVCVSVQDSGIGIAADEQKSVFTPYWRSEQMEVMTTMGYGLKLYIAKAIIEKHGGRMWFESVLDQGTTFYFTLPIST